LIDACFINGFLFCLNVMKNIFIFTVYRANSVVIFLL